MFNANPTGLSLLILLMCKGLEVVNTKTSVYLNSFRSSLNLSE
jgi:hypothetical protein